MSVIGEIRGAIGERRRLWLGIALGIPAAYYAALLLATVLRFGSWPNYARLHDFPGNVRLIFAGTSDASDILDLLGEEILFETGYMHPKFGLAEWSVNLIPAKMLLVLALGALVATFFVLARRPADAGCAAPRTRRAAAATGFGALLIALSSATLTWVVCCSTPTWVVGLAMMGLGVSTALALEPLGTWLTIAGLLSLSAGVLIQARRRASALAPLPAGART